eukprot:758634-Hanusia_phi.AAC.3
MPLQRILCRSATICATRSSGSSGSQKDASDSVRYHSCPRLAVCEDDRSGEPGGMEGMLESDMPDSCRRSEGKRSSHVIPRSLADVVVSCCVRFNQSDHGWQETITSMDRLLASERLSKRGESGRQEEERG